MCISSCISVRVLGRIFHAFAPALEVSYALVHVTSSRSNVLTRDVRSTDVFILVPDKSSVCT